MDDPVVESDARFSILATTLNALDRSRANERMLGSYKCPCNLCKGGGRPIFRVTIETHLRRHGRDPNLNHSMLPEDDDVREWILSEEQDEGTLPESQMNNPQAEAFDEGFDFRRMTSDWFERVDERRGTFHPLVNSEEDCNKDSDEPTEEHLNPDMQQWLHCSQVPLYEGSRVSVLACVLVLMNLAHLHNVSNSFMDELFSFLRLDVLPSSNGLPHTRSEAHKLINCLGLSFSTIHACRNGCILFWKDRAHLTNCPHCKTSRYVEGSTSIPMKVLRHFPLILRLLRMYRCRDIASLMRWHERNASTDGKMRSVLDSPAWKEVKNIDRSFYEEGRNVKLGLALDGMNPFADKSTRHSTWPIFLVNYNLPGWLVTKRFFVMLSLLIPGKESVKSANIDVYLEPLVDDLVLLWNGVPTIDMSDSSQPSAFTLRGMLLWTIHDFPAYGLISGCVTKGYHACPICGPQVDSRFSRSLRKNIFQGHRRYLPHDHPFRFMTDSFNGKQEHQDRPSRVTGSEHRRRGEARQRWLDAGGCAGSENDPIKRYGVKRHSTLFRLPYWEKLLIRHVLDVMHCERNIAENLFMTLLGLKDGPTVRNDMKETGCKRSLHIRNARAPLQGLYMPIASYVLTRDNKKKFIHRLRNLKMPTGYMSNLKSKIDEDGSIHGLKSHDYHILIQQVLPVCLRGLLPKRIMKTILSVSHIFQRLCLKTIVPSQMDSLNEDVAVVLCLLERDFPPSFFDPMTHLPIHLVEELYLCGPVHTRWMYPLERYMKYMKSYVGNKARPEGCMASGTAMEVALGLSTEYILECESTRKRVWDAEEEAGDSGELLCSTYQVRNLSAEECQWAHMCVVNNSSCLDNLRETHSRLSLEIVNARLAYRQGVHPRQRRRMNYPAELDVLPLFPEWLKSVVEEGIESFPDDVVDLSIPVRFRAKSFKSMKAYGQQFRVAEAEVNLLTSDSGVTVTCETLQRSGSSDRNLISGLVTYFGKIKEILELDYGRLKPILLLCDWVAPISRGATASMKKDEYGFTLVKLNRLMRRSANSFVFPNQASQIFFSKCDEEPDWSVVLHTESRKTRVYQEADVEASGPILDRDDEFCRQTPDEFIQEDDVHDSIERTEHARESLRPQDVIMSEVAVEVVAQEMHDEDSEDYSVFDSDASEE